MSRHRVDLNLLRVFEAVLLSRSVSAAGRELGVTPSAVSHALGRLRQALDDDLFVPGEGGMAPTPRAVELSRGIRDGLALIDGAISVRPFDPAKSVRTFRIAATEYGAITLVAPLVERLAVAAPEVELRIFPLARLDVARHLDDGRLDMLIGWFSDLPERIRRKALVEDREAVVVRPGHPLTRAPVTLERIFDFPFLVVELTGTDEQTAEGFLDDRGIWRRVWIDRLLIESGIDKGDLVGHVAVSVPYYSAVAPMLAVSDMVATVPYHLARRYADEGRLAMIDLPYEPLAAQAEVVWHQRSDNDAGMQWLLAELSGVTPGGSVESAQK